MNFFSFSFRFSIWLIKVMKMHKKESKLRALKQTVSLNTVSLISYSHELQPYVKQNNLNLIVRKRLA